MGASIIGRYVWEGERDDEGYRNWNVTHKVRTSDPKDGPQVVMGCAGLPSVGSQYSLSQSNDVDAWAYCYPSMRIRMHEQREGDNTLTWIVEQKFSTRPMLRCSTVAVGNPLLEPMKVGGSFAKYLKQATHDRFGIPILSSSWEPYVGREVEFEASNPTVWIEQNVGTLGLATFSQLVDCLNDSTMWGLPARCVKLSNVTWTRNFYSVCSYYYTRRFEFDINFNTFDRNVPDRGTKVLNGHFGSLTASGCTINVDTISNAGFNDGSVTAFSIGSGGTGYPSSQIITLAITSGTGQGGSVTVQTTGGVVTSAVVVSNGGQGYVAGDVCTTQVSGWVLDNINGVAPDRTNPQHFIRYKDRNGECTPVILDGRGQPAIGRYPGVKNIQKYPQANLFILGVPPSF